ncbi:MAG: right-handed parallel beta-helix repeat-containing protein [Acidobacteriia bacterium]|nr:right-handed parallel beta-helix repeat-containing protein [Terriglobia bacterium]
MRLYYGKARWFHHFLFFFFPLIAAATGYAQPSGGPYGPVHRRYEIPKAAHVYFVAPDAKGDAPGTTLEQPTMLEAAIERVVTGDAIIMRGGVYRTGGLILNQGITLQPYSDERPILKGTQVATTWVALRNNVWRTSWARLFPAAPLGWWQRDREGMRTPLHRFNNDMVFVDGELLRSAGWEGELDAHSFYIDYQNAQVYIGVDPTNKLVEITAFDSALVRTSAPAHGKTSDRKGPVIRGITFTQYAYRALEVEGKKHFTVADEPTDEPVGPSDPATYGKEVVGTVLENVTITYCSRVAGYFRGDGLIVRNCLVSDTSTEGIYVIGSSDVLLERNIIRRNNIEQLTGYYPAAVKIFNQSHRVTCRDNLVIEQPYSNGIWYDVGNRDGVFVNNRIEGAIDGFFFEISRGVTVAGNVFVRCNKGVRVLNSADARVYNNTFVDTPASFERNERSATGDHFGWHPATGPDVDQREGHVFVNNLLVASDAYRGPMLRFEQPRSLCAKLPRPQAKEIDGNVYVRATATDAQPLILWSPAASDSCVSTLGSLDEFRKLVPAFEALGQQFDRTPRSIFRSPELGRYELLQALPGTRKPLPADIRKLLNWSDEVAQSPGAYPLLLK